MMETRPVKDQGVVDDIRMLSDVFQFSVHARSFFSLTLSDGILK